jgi:hypothetical protein
MLSFGSCTKNGQSKEEQAPLQEPITSIAKPDTPTIQTQTPTSPLIELAPSAAANSIVEREHLQKQKPIDTESVSNRHSIHSIKRTGAKTDVPARGISPKVTPAPSFSSVVPTAETSPTPSEGWVADGFTPEKCENGVLYRFERNPQTGEGRKVSSGVCESIAPKPGYLEKTVNQMKNEGLIKKEELGIKKYY